jgi:hypothetical protein
MRISDYKLVGFAGLIGCGKTTAAQFLIKELQFHRVRFAGPLKAMMAALGLSNMEIDDPNCKEQPSALLCGKTPRWAMQSLGTEWGRNLIGDDIWINAWKRSCEGYPHIVVDDVRFPNEARAIKEANGLLVRIVRPSMQYNNSSHASEAQNFGVDHIIYNNGLITELHSQIMQLVLRS